MKFKIKYFLYFCLLAIICTIIIDYVRVSNYRIIPSLPSKEKEGKIDEIYYNLVNGEKQIDWKQVDQALDYVNAQYDVSDFYVATLIRILYEYRDKVPAEMLLKIKNSLLKFRYWMDEPGENSMCYWSENHQILFLSAEYLVGQLYPDEVFVNSKLTGRQHMAKAYQKINDWLEMRWKFGFSEFYSNVYYNEDIAGMINLIDYANDNVIAKKANMIMDLLIYDIASQKSSNMFVSVSGRAYEKNRKGGLAVSINRITDFLWDKPRLYHPNITYGFIASKKYKVPPVLIEIGKDTSNAVIKQTNSLNISQLKEEGYFGTDDKSIMMQWGMEAYSNPEVVRNSISYIRKNNMFSNSFFIGFRRLDNSLFRLFHLEPALIRYFNPQTNGAVIQQANTYTYRTANYSLYSVQSYYPGNNANQQHVAGMNIGNYFSVFHTHPALPDKIKYSSPNYWVGYGRLPHVAQDSSVSLSIYNLPDKKGQAEMAMLHYTHAYFPKELFDTVYLINNYAFGKKGKVYCALIGRNNFYYKNNSSNDLIQPGKLSYWIIEAGNEVKDGSFKNFFSRIMKNKVEFNSETLRLIYVSKGKELELTYSGSFLINNSIVNTKYGRFDSPYIKAKFKPDSLHFQFNRKFLHLDFYKMQRDFN